MIKHLLILFFLILQCADPIQTELDIFTENSDDNFLVKVEKYRIEQVDSGYELYVYPEDFRYQTDLVLVVTHEPTNIIGADVFYYPNIKPKSDGSAMVTIYNRDPDKILAIYIHLQSVNRGR
jgi:hypothetical protein